MKKKLLATTFLLLLTSLIAKTVSFTTRIIIARTLDDTAMNLYSLAMPTLLFLLTISYFGIPSALTKLISSNKENKHYLSASIIISLVNNILLVIFTILFIPIYAKYILKQEVLIPVLYSIVPILLPVAISGLFKGYLIGKYKIIISQSAQVFEEICRLLFFVLFANNYTSSPITLASFAIFSLCIGEIASCLYLGIYIMFHKNASISKVFSFKIPIAAYQEVFKISVPMTSSKLIGSFTLFLEPIIMLSVVAFTNHNQMIDTYTSINAYILPLLTLPSFSTIAISNWVLTSFSNAYSLKDKTKCRQIFCYSNLFALFVGSIVGIALFLFPYEIANLLYKKDSFAPLLKITALPFIIYAAQPILGSILYAANRSKNALFDTFCGCTIRLSIIFIFSPIIGDLAIVLALLASMITTTLLHFINVCFIFHNYK